MAPWHPLNRITSNIHISQCMWTSPPEETSCLRSLGQEPCMWTQLHLQVGQLIVVGKWMMAPWRGKIEVNSTCFQSWTGETLYIYIYVYLNTPKKNTRNILANHKAMTQRVICNRTCNSSSNPVNIHETIKTWSAIFKNKRGIWSQLCCFWIAYCYLEVAHFHGLHYAWCPGKSGVLTPQTVRFIYCQSLSIIMNHDKSLCIHISHVMPIPSPKQVRQGIWGVPPCCFFKAKRTHIETWTKLYGWLLFGKSNLVCSDFYQLVQGGGQLVSRFFLKQTPFKKCQVGRNHENI